MISPDIIGRNPENGGGATPPHGSFFVNGDKRRFACNFTVREEDNCVLVKLVWGDHSSEVDANDFRAFIKDALKDCVTPNKRPKIHYISKPMNTSTVMSNCGVNKIASIFYSVMIATFRNIAGRKEKNYE